MTISSQIAATQLFEWTSFDADSLLPGDWDAELLEIARRHAVARTLIPTSSTSRESQSVESLPSLTVGGVIVRRELPWLAELYETTFLELAQRTVDEPVVTAHDPRYGVVLNVKRGRHMRYECHLDSNPLEGLLYATTHAPGEGGDLVVSNRGDVPDMEAVDADCSRIHPVKGQLVFFDGSRNSHYVRPLVSDDTVRVVAAMNYYVPSLPEALRPADLNRHLFGED
jgi:hypothetical protein